MIMPTSFFPVSLVFTANDLAQKISAMFGSGIDIWLKLQKTYDEKVIELEQQKSLDEQKEILQMIDYESFRKIASLCRIMTGAIIVLGHCLSVKLTRQEYLALAFGDDFRLPQVFPPVNSTLDGGRN